MRAYLPKVLPLAIKGWRALPKNSREKNVLFADTVIDCKSVSSAERTQGENWPLEAMQTGAKASPDGTSENRSMVPGNRQKRIDL